MERLMNVAVKFAKKVKEGEGEYGPWVLWNFTITDPDWDGIWFSWFSGGNKPIPVAGLKVDMIEYEVTEKDGYTNYNAKKLLVSETGASNPKPLPKNTTQGPKQASTTGTHPYINHGEVVCNLIGLSISGDGVDRTRYEKLLNAFKFGIRALTTDAPIKPKQEPKPEPVQEYPEPEEDSIPF